MGLNWHRGRSKVSIGWVLCAKCLIIFSLVRPWCPVYKPSSAEIAAPKREGVRELRAKSNFPVLMQPCQQGMHCILQWESSKLRIPKVREPFPPCFRDVLWLYWELKGE